MHKVALLHHPEVTGRIISVHEDVDLGTGNRSILAVLQQFKKNAEVK